MLCSKCKTDSARVQKFDRHVCIGGHMLCSACSEEFLAGCPICGGEIVKKIQVYVDGIPRLVFESLGHEGEPIVQMHHKNEEFLAQDSIQCLSIRGNCGDFEENPSINIREEQPPRRGQYYFRDLSELSEDEPLNQTLNELHELSNKLKKIRERKIPNNSLPNDPDAQLVLEHLEEFRRSVNYKTPEPLEEHRIQSSNPSSRDTIVVTSKTTPDSSEIISCPSSISLSSSEEKLLQQERLLEQENRQNGQSQEDPAHSCFYPFVILPNGSFQNATGSTAYQPEENIMNYFEFLGPTGCNPHNFLETEATKVYYSFMPQYIPAPVLPPCCGGDYVPPEPKASLENKLQDEKTEKLKELLEILPSNLSMSELRTFIKNWIEKQENSQIESPPPAQEPKSDPRPTPNNKSFQKHRAYRARFHVSSATSNPSQWSIQQEPIRSPFKRQEEEENPPSTEAKHVSELRLDRAPIICPVSNCAKPVFVSEIVTHVKTNHFHTVLEAISPGQTKCFAWDPKADHHGMRRCLMTYLLTDKIRGIGSGQFKNYLPILLMSTKFRISKLLGQQVYSNSDASFYMVWLTGLVIPELPVDYSLCIWSPAVTDPGVHHCISNRLLSLRNCQDLECLYSSGNALIISTKMYEKLTREGRDMARLQVIIH